MRLDEMSLVRLDEALESWRIDLRSRNCSPRTIDTYTLAVTQLADWLKNRNHSLSVSEITTTDLRSFIGWMLANRSDSTAQQRYRSLNVFFAWLSNEGEIESSPMTKVAKPKVADKPIEIVGERQVKLLLETCDSSFRGKRDEAIIRLLYDTGLRVGELCGLRVEDVNLDLELMWVDGKTGLRQVPFTVATTRSLDRYIRIRRKHRNAHLPDLWLSERGRGATLTKSGVFRLLDRRSSQAQIGHVHPHQFRHTAADRLLSAGMSEGSVMEVMGWTDRSMLDRYGRSVRHRRAIEDYRKLVG